MKVALFIAGWLVVISAFWWRVHVGKQWQKEQDELERTRRNDALRADGMQGLREVPDPKGKR